MKLPYSLIHVAVLSTVFTASNAYAENQFVGKTLSAQEAETYWTPERLRNAIPFPLPTVKPSNVQEAPPSLLPKSETNIYADGTPPRYPLKPDMHQLFSPKKTISGPILRDRGTANQDYTSSALVPETADLSYPYSAVGKLYFVNGGIGYVCTASVIAPRVVITAAHCAHGTNGYYKSFKFIPAFRNGAAPYESWGATFVVASASWVAGDRNIPNQADYALLEIQDRTINTKPMRVGDVVGVLGYQLQSLVPNHAHLLGYPCNLDSCNKMHQITSQSARAVLPNDGEYGSDMLGGASGGPWIQNFGIKSVGQTDGKNPGFNRVLGVSSYARVDERLIGASNLGTAFSSILSTVCARNSGNC